MILEVKYSASHDCFIRIPKAHTVKLRNAQLLHITSCDFQFKSVVLATSSKSSGDAEYAEIDGTLADYLGIPEFATIRIEPALEEKPLLEIHVLLESGDFEVVQQNMEYFEVEFMNQVKAVNRLQLFPLYINNVPCKCSIGDLVPDDCKYGIVSRSTRVIFDVCESVSSLRHDTEIAGKEEEHSLDLYLDIFSDRAKYLMSYFLPNTFRTEEPLITFSEIETKFHNEIVKEQLFVTARVTELDNDDKIKFKSIYQPCHVFMSSHMFKMSTEKPIATNSFLAKIRIISPGIEVVQKKNDKDERNLIARIILIDMINDFQWNIDKGDAMIAREMFEMYNMAVSYPFIISITQLSIEDSCNNSIFEMPKMGSIFKCSNDRYEEAFNILRDRFPSCSHPALIPVKCAVRINCNVFFILSKNTSCLFLYLDLERLSFANLEKFVLKVADIEKNNLPLVEKSALSKSQILKVFNFDHCKEVMDLVECLVESLGFISADSRRPLAKIFLLKGRSGIGKSSALSCIKHKLENRPYSVYVKVINCETLRGKKPGKIGEILRDEYKHLVDLKPSLLILDDLDSLCCYLNEAQEQNLVNKNYFELVSLIILQVFSEIKNQAGISLISVIKDTSDLNSILMMRKGMYPFDKIITLVNPNSEQRKIILSEILSSYGLKKFDSYVNKLARMTDGFIVGDLAHLCRKVISSFIRPFEEEAEPTERDFDVALSDFTPMSLWGLKLRPPGDGVLADVGGLREAKKILVETFLWPAKYPKLFASCPLRTRSGVLLYGLPGTGKTLLANAVARECGLNFVGVKGPELLSKYIGSSEKAVRELFERARRATPCVLFFDEFDSLAPRRGHDSTGVTDRVVNQLLTQLDGVEGGNDGGVFVLAATSRPDLIDPALTRPGRLDKSVRCEMPDHEDRREMLEILSRRLELAEDVDLRELATTCEGFTGADLRGLLCSAQLVAFNEIKSRVDYNLEEKFVINTTHLQLALKDTRPSITVSERMKFDAIYESMDENANQKMPKYHAQVGQRVSLA